MVSSRGQIVLIMLVAVVALAVGETLLAKGMKQTGRIEGGWLAQGTAVAQSGWIWAGCLLLLLHLGLYMLALSGADLSFALPLTAASYPLAALLAKYYLHENVGTARWVGTFLITLGVAALGRGLPRGCGAPGPRAALVSRARHTNPTPSEGTAFAWRSLASGWCGDGAGALCSRRGVKPRVRDRVRPPGPTAPGAAGSPAARHQTAPRSRRPPPA